MLTLTQIAGRLGIPAEPSRHGTTPGSSPGIPSTTKANASTRRPARTRPAGHKDANSANDASPATPLPHTTLEPAGSVGPHRYRLHQDNNRTPRIDPKRCSMQPEVSPSGCAAGSSPPRSGDRTVPRRMPRRTGRPGPGPGTGTGRPAEPGGPLPQVHEQVPCLLHGPRAVRVRGDAEDMDVTGAQLDHEEHVETRRKVTAPST